MTGRTAKFETMEKKEAPTPSQKTNGRIAELDGWRAISVLLVITAHYVVLQHGEFLARHPAIAPLFHSLGPLGVSAFFVISGFVICRLLIAEEAQTGSVSLKGFYCRRAFRILPPFLLYLAGLLLLASFHFVYARRMAILPSIFFLCDLNLVPRAPFVAHTWSLAVEEQFYLIFPGVWRLISSRWRLQVGIAAFLLCALWNLAQIYSGSDLLVLHKLPVGFSCICCGVLMATHEDIVRAAVRRVHWIVVLLLAALVLIHPLKLDSWQEALFDSFVFPPAIGLILLFSVEHRGWLAGVLRSRPLQAIGVTSYGIYLWQELFTATPTNYAPKGYWLRGSLGFLLIIVPLSYVLIEKPAMRLGKYLSEQAKARSIQDSQDLLAPV